VILVVAPSTDLSGRRVLDILHGLGAQVARLDPADFPSKTASTAVPGLTFSGTTSGVPLAEVRAAWLRTPSSCRPAAAIADASAQRFVELESTAYLHDLWSCFEWSWLPGPPHTILLAQRKIQQLSRAAAMGFAIPDTRVTNDPDEVLALFRHHEGRIVSKLLGTGLRRSFEGRLRRYTERVDVRHLADSESIRLAPAIYQECLDKEFEVRVTVVGDEVYAAAIRSQATNRTRLDWRRYDRSGTPIDEHQLPDGIRDRCLALVAGYGLGYGAIDLVVTRDGRYVFLELNPAGQYLWIEDATQLPISDAIARRLLSMDRTGT
jgi:hypothetical protein